MIDGTKPNRRGAIFRRVARTLWLVLVAGFVALFAYDRRDQLLAGITAFDPFVIFGALLLICIAKLGFVWNVQFAARKFDIRLGWKESFRIYNLTQLAKYIPGSIWQFVGRVAILRERGVEAARIRDSLLAEHLWVIGVASLLGVLLLASSDPLLLTRSADWLGGARSRDTVWMLTVVGGLIGTGIFVWRFKAVLGWAWSLVPPWRVIPLLVLTWMLFGSALWVTVVSVAPETSLGYVIGLYCVAYVVGFVVPFAPAGVGVREAILVLGLVPLVPTETAVLLAVVNRLVYLTAEIVLALFCIGNVGAESRTERAG